MGFFGKAWEVVKDVGIGIISGILGTIVHYFYIAFVFIANVFKSKKRISACLIKVMEDLNLLSNNVDYSKVRIIQNAIGLDGAGLTNNYTIYFSGSFDEYDRMKLLLHEIKTC